MKVTELNWDEMYLTRVGYFSHVARDEYYLT